METTSSQSDIITTKGKAMAAKLPLFETVLSYPKLKERVAGRKEEENKVRKILKELAADFHEGTYKKVIRSIEISMGLLYDDVDMESPEGIDLKKLSEEANFVIVPNHQSHADYIALNFINYRKNNFAFHIAGGINLNIFPIGKIFRQSGCFFIRRSFASDVLYKMTFEAYIYYLLKVGYPIQFFFEGGRTRSGKLMAPRYGLYQMLITAHEQLVEEGHTKELLFIPASIAHEYVPEQKSLSKELSGGAKTKESTRQLFKLYRLLSLKLGSIHIKVGNPIGVPQKGSLKDKLRKVAFDCFLAVGDNMKVTPTSLISLILLDEPTGALQMVDINKRAREILEYCKEFNVPISKTLVEDKYEGALERAIDLFISNKKLNVIGHPSLGHVFYSFKEECRFETLFFKNTILHHFIVPWVINNAWLNVTNGNIKDTNDIRKFFIQQRDQLRHEFYLPSMKDYYIKAMKIISHCVGRKIEDLDSCMGLTTEEMHRVKQKIGVFGRSLSYIIEGYYLLALAIKKLEKESSKGNFKVDELRRSIEDIFEIEKKTGKFVRFIESKTPPLLTSSLKYYVDEDILEKEPGHYRLKNEKLLNEKIELLANDLEGQLG
ncbi:MAG: 1-acyl-sn-glycerol-3-phosphate acyltransferase [Halobacteriovoraceae bacterium]|nr:1-acyl-sn-glycerol-3-phosphate acyltransferase [Halobacteriovoraceae bacterium]